MRPVLLITTIPASARRPAPSSPATGSKPRCCIRTVAGCRNSSRVTSPRWRDRRAGWPRRSVPGIDEGYDIIALVPSCALMLKFEWPLILPGDPLIEKLAKATFDVSEYIVDIARKEGLARGL